MKAELLEDSLQTWVRPTELTTTSSSDKYICDRTTNLTRSPALSVVLFQY
ncbi:hypothetical protein [Nostoc sp. CALU 546]